MYEIKTVFAEIDRLSGAYADIWEDVCCIESPSCDKIGVDRVGAYFRKLAEMRSWEIEMFRQERFGDAVCITMNARSSGRPIALSGHMDTVHPVGSFGTPAARREGDRLYGPGTMDCKGGIVAGLLAMDALERCGFRERPVMLLLQSNEEIGSGLQNKESIQWICQKAKDAEAFLNLEGQEGYFDGKACLIRKGITGFRFCIRGIAAHASYCAKEGASAIREAAHKIIEIEKIKDHDGVTCSCGLISGGTAENTVPDRCEFTVDVRFSSQEQYGQAVSRLQEIADTVFVPGCSCTMEQTGLRPAMELNERNTALLNRANTLFAESGLTPLEIGKRTGGSDAADVTVFGIPCMDSIGVRGEGAHTTEEYGCIGSLAESAKRVAAVVCGL